MDCMDLMREFPDKYFDLAIVDPPYGIGEDWKKRNKTKNTHESQYKNKSIPDKHYFNELFRVSKNQIIWGYNYFTDFLGPTNYLICWDKVSNNNEVFLYSKFELAYSSFKIPASIITVPWDGYRMGKETGNKKIHPHQKPVELYRKVLKKYAKPKDKILDTHLGSGAIAIACHDYNFDLIASEIDKNFFTKTILRVKAHTNQIIADL